MNLSMLNIFFKALGINEKSFTITDIIVRFMRFMPLLIEHFHILEQSSPNTGKSFVSKSFSENFKMITALTTAKIFGSTSGKDGYISSTNKAILFDEISNLNQSDLPPDLRSALKSYLNGDDFSRGDKENLSTTSCYFVGNTLDIIQESLDKNPNIYSNDIFNNIPEFFLENSMIERLIWNPGWLLKKTDETNLSDDDSEPPLKQVIEFIQNKRGPENNKIKISFTNNTRNCKKARKIITGFIVALYDSNFSPDNINQLMEFTEFIINLGYGKYSIFWNTHSGKKFLLNFLFLYIPTNSSISRVFFSKYRILVVTKENPNKIYKIAINKYGITENENEIKLYNSNSHFSKLVAHVEKYNNTFITIIQDYYEFLDLKDEFKHISLNPMEEEITKLKEEINKLSKAQENLDKFTNDIISKYNYLLEFTLSLKNNFPIKFPEKIILNDDNFINTNFNNFSAEIISLNLNLRFQNNQLGCKNGEYKIMNFS